MTNGEKYKTAQERAAAFTKFCYQKQRTDSMYCEYHGENHCPICTMTWLDLEAKEEEPLPCPFCKHPQVRVYADENKKRVYCPVCGFTMPWRDLTEDVYDEYNRVAKAAGEREANNG